MRKAPLDRLPHKLRVIIALRLGLDGYDCYSLAEVGRILRISRWRARSLEAKALQLLKDWGWPTVDFGGGAPPCCPGDERD